jgi:Domain of unknown function (DUF4160)
LFRHARTKPILRHHHPHVLWRPCATHFHAVYQGEEIKVNINTLVVLEGDMTRRAQALVLEWAALHWTELRQAWELASANKEPSKIAPLE